VLVWRRPLAACCAALAVLAVVGANAAPAPPHAWVLTAAHDVAAGAVLADDDLVRTPFDPSLVPEGAERDAAGVVGRTTTTPIRRGEPLTDVRLVTRSLLSGYPGLVALPVRVGDPGVAHLLRVGDRVDLVAADPQGEHPAALVAADVPVLALPRGSDDSSTPGLGQGALVVAGVSPDEVPQVAQAGVSAFLMVVLRQ
jgi:Flp pilus assembly protein CpaB